MTFRSDFVANLPPDPDDALIVLADRATDWLEAPERPDDNVNYAYIAQIFDRFLTRYRPEIKETISNSSPAVKDYVEAIVRFSGAREVDRLIDNYERLSDDAGSFGIATLTSIEKELLHKHIDNIRRIVQQSPIEVRKKNALFHRLDALRSEVDSIGTRTDRFFAFAGDVSFVMGDMAEKAKPFIEEVKDILKIIRGSRARTENIKLPHEETLKLPSPEEEHDTTS